MKQIIENKIKQSKKELSTLKNKRVPVYDINQYREIYIDIQLHIKQIEHLENMLQEERYDIVI